MHEDISVRVCIEHDIALLACRFSSGDARVHAFRYARQQQGRSIYLLAWLAGAPVGHLDLWWQAAEDAPSAQPHLVGCAELNAITVLPEYRSQGIGTRLIATAEQMARTRGFREVCVGVEPENTRARSLYKRLGYVDWGHGVVDAYWLLPDEQGLYHAEQAVYLRKKLGSE
ncbi:MAG: GNAT family N-acetyltransferase [Armatimonadota bacterium]|jgi:ribosomal protein S18 acetylase RimI-like enzyme